MIDYKNGKIYKIVDINEEMIYVGATVNSLSRRMTQHRADYKRKHYVSSHNIFDKYGIKNCKILLLENYPCNSKDELCKREGEYIKQLNCVNKKFAGRTDLEWRFENKEHIRERNKIYCENNKEHIRERKKIYCENNKEHIIEQAKLYYEANREKRKQQMKLYNEANKEKIKQQMKLYYEANKNKNLSNILDI